jgi:hypothetical protein
MSFEMAAMFLGDRKETIEKVYGHHSPDWMRDAAEALSGPMAPKTQLATRRKAQ